MLFYGKSMEKYQEQMLKQVFNKRQESEHLKLLFSGKVLEIWSHYTLWLFTRDLNKVFSLKVSANYVNARDIPEERDGRGLTLPKGGEISGSSK